MDQDKELGPLAADTGSRDLYFLVGEPHTRLSYHQLLVTRYSVLLRELLQPREQMMGVDEVTVSLGPEVSLLALTKLMECLYTAEESRLACGAP